MAAQHDPSRIWSGPRVLVLVTAIALVGWAADGAAQGTSGARIGSAGLDAGTLVGSIGAGPGLSGGTADRANRIRNVAAPPGDEEAPSAAPAADTAPAAPGLPPTR